MMPSVSGVVRSAWRRRTLLMVLASLLAVELFVRMPGFWTSLPGSSAGWPDVFIEAALRGSTDSQVIVMGSSRFQTDVSPRTLAETLGLPASQVVNLSFPLGSPMDFVAVYRRHRPLLRRAEVLIVGVDAFQFNWWSHTEGALKNRFRQRAPFSWRVAAPGWQAKIDLIAGWFWRTWDTRRTLKSYLHALRSLRFTSRKPAEDELGRLMFWEQSTKLPSPQEAREHPFKMDFRDFNFAEPQLQSLEDLLALATNDGVQVLLVEAPQSPLTLEQIAQHFAAEEALWRQLVETATGLPVEQVPFDDTRCANWQDCFVDYGHMNTNGAVAYSEAMGAWLLSRFPISVESISR